MWSDDILTLSNRKRVLAALNDYRFTGDLHTNVSADGFVIIECEEPGTGHATGQVILDYLTDTVVNKKATVRGSPLVSPDSRVVVSIDKAADGVTLVVQQVLGT